MMGMPEQNYNERVLIVEQIEGKATKSNTGLVDSRLFKDGGNKLRAVRNGATCLWSFKYDIGAVPAPLKDVQFTSFDLALAEAKAYFGKRNLNVRAAD